MDMIKHRKLLADLTCETICINVKNQTLSVDKCSDYSCVDLCPETCDISPPTTSTLFHRHHAISQPLYNKDDGIVEGTDCSVCLSEFEKDETVRLLPKCNHAFHISCIDTWLRSHTNCPNCRAPIVVNSEGGTGNGNNSSDMVRLDVISDNEEPTVIREEEENELDGDDKEEEEDIIQPMRRSVSLDSLSALKIHQGVADLNSELESSLSNVNSVAKTNGNQILPLPRSIASSSSARFFNFQSGQTSLKRSITWNGKFLSSRHNHSRSQSSIGQP
ncbi:hypothetical protein ACFE04_024397 [Oxalis oulophora]